MIALRSIRLEWFLQTPTVQKYFPNELPLIYALKFLSNKTYTPHLCLLKYDGLIICLHNKNNLCLLPTIPIFFNTTQFFLYSTSFLPSLYLSLSLK